MAATRFTVTNPPHGTAIAQSTGSDVPTVSPAIAEAVAPFQSPAGVLVMLVLLGTAMGAGLLGYIQWRRTEAQLRLEKLKNRDLVKKLKLALNAIAEFERNPDLLHSREFNLDYLSMRMDESIFREVILAQIKIHLKQKVAPALMPPQDEEGEKGEKTSPRKVDVTFDISYKPEHQDAATKPRVLFRIQVKLAKVPTQSTSKTIKDLASALENFISATEENRNWQPTIQGRIAKIGWDQKAKPTPLLSIEQTNEGSNVVVRPSFRRRVASSSGASSN